MEDNEIRTVTDMQEDNNGGAVEMQDNSNVRQGRRQRKRQKSMVAEMWNNRDVVWQQMRCGTKYMAKWVGTTATD